MATLAGIDIGDDVVWTDLGDWSAVQRTDRRTLGGGVVLHSRPLHAGRPITLDLGNTADGWPRLSLAKSLRTLRDADATMALDLGALGAYTVRFRHGDGAPVEAAPVIGLFSDPDPDDFVEITLRLVSI